MQIKGSQFIGNTATVPEGKDGFQAVNPATQEILDGYFVNATQREADAAVQLAARAFEVFRKKTPDERARFLEAVAEGLLAEPELITRCMQETALPEQRLVGERLRTVNQLRLFAEVIREGSWVNARIDHALPDRKPLPRPDIRSMNIAIGPVVVFGASNFPFAFSVAGGDTASAWAAGCPVVFKSHPLHPGTSEMVASIIAEAAQVTGMPDGVFSLLQGNSNEVGMALVLHSLIKAVAFTGSYGGGTAIFKATASRPEPIPVYAEMGSSNPVFILPGAVRDKGEQIAKALVDSFTLGVGQFCTNPGVFVGIKGDLFSKLIEQASGHVNALEAAPMLGSVIQKKYRERIEEIVATGHIEKLSAGIDKSIPGTGVPHLFKAEVKSALTTAAITEEIFGPCSVALTAQDHDEILSFARSLHGHLTATIHATDEDAPLVAELLEILENKVGRVIYNGYPTGVEVCHAMVHGGPFPATTDSRSTSVGTAAIHRFARPVCYQNFPQQVLPPELRDGNPSKILRLVNGVYTRE